jgi:hypothetical protein
MKARGAGVTGRRGFLGWLAWLWAGVTLAPGATARAAGRGEGAGGGGAGRLFKRVRRLREAELYEPHRWEG